MLRNPLRPTPCIEALGTASKRRRAAKQSLALSIARDLDVVIDEEVDSIISINSDCNTPLDSPRTLAAEVVVNFDWCHVGDGRVGDLCEYLSDFPFSFARIFWQHDISGYLERQKTLMNGEPGCNEPPGCSASASKGFVYTYQKSGTMSSAHFEDYISKAGDVGTTNVKALLAALETAHLVVTPEQLQNGLVALGYDGVQVLSALDMALLFKKLSAEVGHDFTNFAAEVGEGESSRMSVEDSASHGVSGEEDSADATVPFGMTLADFDAALTGKSSDSMRSLPLRVKCVVVDRVNKLLFNSGDADVVGLDQEDILKLRDAKLATALPDIIDSAVAQDQGLYITYEGGGKELVLDLASLASKQQEEFRTVWSTISEKRRQDAVAEVQRQFKVHLSEIGTALDEGDVKLLRDHWMKAHLIPIVHANAEATDTAASEFPFGGSSWPDEITDVYKIIWWKLSDAEKDGAFELMQRHFNAYLMDYGFRHVDDSTRVRLWDTWSLKGFKDATEAVKAKDFALGFIFKPEVPIDTIEDEEEKKNAMTVQARVTEEQETLIKEEVLRGKELVREQLGALGSASIGKYQQRFLKKEYWKIVMRVVQRNSGPPNEKEASSKKIPEDRSASVDGSASEVGPASPSSSPVSSALCPVNVPAAAAVAAADEGAFNMGNVLRAYASPRSPVTSAELVFGSACAAFSGELSGVRWVYECFVANTDVDIRGGDGKKEVATIVTCDQTGALLITIWPPCVEVFKKIVKEHNFEAGQLILRFEQLKFTPLPKNDWNGSCITPIRMGHTLTPEKPSPSKRARLEGSEFSVSARDGTRLSVLREATSPYMRSDLALPMPRLPSVVVSYSSVLSKAVSPFRVTIAGTIHELEDIETTNSGELRRNFKLADDEGKWIHCIAHGRHAEGTFLQNMRRIIAYFGSGRSGLGTMPQALWLFKDSFMVPLERRPVSPLITQVEWQ